MPIPFEIDRRLLELNEVVIARLYLSCRTRAGGAALIDRAAHPLMQRIAPRKVLEVFPAREPRRTALTAIQKPRSGRSAPRRSQFCADQALCASVACSVYAWRENADRFGPL